jgi:hypothetical protein
MRNEGFDKLCMTSTSSNNDHRHHRTPGIEHGTRASTKPGTIGKVRCSSSEIEVPFLLNDTMSTKMMFTAVVCRRNIMKTGEYVGYERAS